MNVELLEHATAALGKLSEEVVFLGAATIPLWLTDAAAPAPRPTRDVDLVVEVFTLPEYQRFEARLRDAGFRDHGGMIGRFLFGEEDRQLDVIPADASILGFRNKWQRDSLPDARRVNLPSGSRIRALPAPNLLATKFEAFVGRGAGDFLGSPDFEDIVALIDGRSELPGEVADSSPELRTYLASQARNILDNDRATEAIVAHLQFGRGGRERADAVVMPRLEKMSAET